MSPNKADEYSSDCEFNYYDEPILVASYVKDIVLVADIIRSQEILLDF